MSANTPVNVNQAPGPTTGNGNENDNDNDKSSDNSGNATTRTDKNTELADTSMTDAPASVKPAQIQPQDPNQDLKHKPSSGVVEATKVTSSVSNVSATEVTPTGALVSRKRSKISRACDECRRKKIRCDGGSATTTGTAIVPCSSCHKSGDRCSFSRVPLKRGPSKRLGAMKTDFIPVYSNSNPSGNSINPINNVNTHGYIHHSTHSLSSMSHSQAQAQAQAQSHNYRHRSLSDLGVSTSPPRAPMHSNVHSNVHPGHMMPFNPPHPSMAHNTQRRPSATSTDDQSSVSSSNSIVSGRLHPRLPSIDSLTATPPSVPAMPGIRVPNHNHNLHSQNNHNNNNNAYFSKANTSSGSIFSVIQPPQPVGANSASASNKSHIIYQNSSPGSMSSASDSSDVLMSPKSDAGGVSPLTGPNLTSMSGSSASSSAIPPLPVQNVSAFTNNIRSNNNINSNSNSNSNAPGKMAPRMSVSDDDNIVGWDDRCIDCYYQLVHPTLPVLPANRIKLKSRLQACPHSNIREALMYAVSGLVSNNIEELANIDYRSQVVKLLPVSSSTLDVPSHILVLMTLVLCYLQTSETSWLGSAIGTVFDLNAQLASISASKDTHVANNLAGSNTDSRRSREISTTSSTSNTSNTSSSSLSSDGETDEVLARRLFLLLVLLNCLHATVKSVPLMIADTAINIIQAKDEECFDIAGSFSSKKTGVEMVRLGLLAAQINNGSDDSPEHLNMLKQSLWQIRDDTENLWDSSPILKALYHYVKVVYDRRAKDVNTLIGDISKLVILLDSPLASVSPLVSVFIPMLRNTLIDIGNQSQTEESSRELHGTVMKQLDLLDLLIIRKFPEFGKSHLQQHRLQGLAAIAQLSETIYSKYEQPQSLAR